MALTLDRWENLGNMVLPRAGCALGVVGDRVIVVGGTHWQDGTKRWVDRADALDPQSGQWTPLPAYPHPVGEAAAVVHEGKLIVIGGGTAEGSHRDSWQFDGAGWARFGPDLPAPRRFLAAVPAGDELVLLGGMMAGPTDYATATSVVWRGGREGWREVAPMPGPARLGFAAGKLDGRIVIAGGFAAAGSGVVNLDEILAYDLAADTWQRIGRLPVPVRAIGGLAWPGRGLLAFGGYSDAFGRDIWLVEASGAVTRIGELPVGLADGKFARWRDRIVGLSGEDGMKLRYASCLRSVPLAGA